MSSKLSANFWTRFSVCAFLVVVALVFSFPTLQMLLNSFKSNQEIVSNPAGLPIDWTLASYIDGLAYRGLGRNLLNSVIVCSISSCVAVFLCAAAAYGFSKFEFSGKNVLFGVLLTTMMVPPEVLIPGQFLLFARLGLMDTLTVQIIPTVTPVMGLFLMRQYMTSLPNEVLEAARIDGASEFTIFYRLVLPMSKPVLSAYAILHFLTAWNAYLWPSIAVTSDEVKPLMVKLPALVDSTVGFLPVYGTIMAGCALATVPLIAVFLFFQDKVMNSVTIGGVK